MLLPPEAQAILWSASSCGGRWRLPCTHETSLISRPQPTFVARSVAHLQVSPSLHSQVSSHGFSELRDTLHGPWLCSLLSTVWWCSGLAHSFRLDSMTVARSFAG